MRTRKKKSDTENDRLIRENRELKALNRSLMKRIKKLDRNFKESEEKEESINDTDFEAGPSLTNKCPECTKGNLIVVSLAGRSFSRCSLCEHRTKAIKLK